MISFLKPVAVSVRCFLVPAKARAILTTESVRSPFHAEPTHPAKQEVDALPTKPKDCGTIIERLAALPSDEFLSQPKLSTRDSFASHQAPSPGVSCHRC